MKKSIMSKVIHFLLVSILLFVFNNCDKPFKSKPYSFFIAGHTYGYPGYEIERNGLHPPFKYRFDLIKENNFIEFGVFLGDIVWEPSIEAWNNVDRDINEIGKPIYFAIGNHDAIDRDLFESRYGDTYFHFIVNDDLFIVLDPNIDSWNISGEQLIYLTSVLENNYHSVDHIFVFFHQLLWWTPNNIYKNIVFNSIAGRADSINFWTEIEPLFHSLPNEVIMMAGDLGAFSWIDAYMYDKYDNITFIASGMGACGEPRCLGEVPYGDTKGWDNFIIINIDENKKINYEIIAINRKDINEIGSLEDYQLP